VEDDFDGDGMANSAEYISGTDPMDPDSYLHLLNITPGGDDEVVSWAASTMSPRFQPIVPRDLLTRAQSLRPTAMARPCRAGGTLAAHEFHRPI